LRSKMPALRLKLSQRGTKRVVAQIVSWYASEAHLGVLEYAFSRIQELARRARFKVVVVPIPYLSDEDADLWEIVYQMITDESKLYGFDTVSVYRDFKSAGFDKLLIQKNDLIHPNHAGHLIIANKLAEYVNRRY